MIAEFFGTLNPDYALERRELLSFFAYKGVMNPNSQHLQVRFRGLITPLSIKILQHFITAYYIIRVYLDLSTSLGL